MIIHVVKEDHAKMVRIYNIHHLNRQNQVGVKKTSSHDDTKLIPWLPGACCPKETGYCNYGPKACGTDNNSPNDVCWSNCDAKAECGRYADPPGKKCPLNVVCTTCAPPYAHTLHPFKPMNKYTEFVCIRVVLLTVWVLRHPARLLQSDRRRRNKLPKQLQAARTQRQRWQRPEESHWLL